jgi:hypothetical protein
VGPEELGKLEELRARKASLAQRFSALPTSEAEIESRRKRLQGKVDELDREAFKLGYELQHMSALKQAIEKLTADAARQGGKGKDQEREFLALLEHELAVMEAAEAELQGVRNALADQRATAATSTGGEDLIRAEYARVLAEEHALWERAEERMSGPAQNLVTRAHAVREEIEGLRGRVRAAKKHIKEQLARRGSQIRAAVIAEQQLLEAYGEEVGAISRSARNLVGQIAFDSFQRVRQQFEELVLKADLGRVDVAFTRKQDKTAEIQRLAQQKDRQLRRLDEEFREVLRDVD